MKIAFALLTGSLFFGLSCTMPTNCYRCITVTSNNYQVQTIDTIMKCDLTSKDAKTYEVAHTVNGKVGDPTPGTTTATNCQIPTN